MNKIKQISLYLKTAGPLVCFGKLSDSTLISEICRMWWKGIFLLFYHSQGCVTLRVDKGRNNVTWPFWDKPEHLQVVEVSFEHADGHLNPGFSPAVGQTEGQSLALVRSVRVLSVTDKETLNSCNRYIFV